MIRAITVCVGYDDFLSITLPRTLPHVDEYLIVSHPGDQRTTALVQDYDPKVRLFHTDAFYRHGAKFNKGLAMEEGFDALGRHGWILILDADIILPTRAPLDLDVGKLYTPLRRIYADIATMSKAPDVDPGTLPLKPDKGHYGYFQLFHADDPVLRSRPWYGVDWTHAGGCDKYFQDKWVVQNRTRPDFEVVHLGNPDENWFGRVSPRVDGGVESSDLTETNNRKAMQEQLKKKHGWGRRKARVTLNEKVKIPELPAAAGQPIPPQRIL